MKKMSTYHLLLCGQNFHPSVSSSLGYRSCPVVCSAISYPAVALTTQAACLLRGNTLDLKPFLCPQAGYLCYTGSAQPSLNCICPEPADTGYNGDIDVLLRNPWVRIKELLASQQGQQESVWTQDNVFLQHAACPQDAVALLAPWKKKRFCDITCQIYALQSKQYAWIHAQPICERSLLCCSVSMWSLLRLCLLEPELRWHFIYINNYYPESPLGLPRSNQTSNALKIAHHLLLMEDYKMHCYSCTLLCSSARKWCQL